MAIGITKDQIIMQVVKENPLLASIVDRFGIQYSHWTLSVEKACALQNTDAHLLLQMLRIFNENNYFPKEELEKLSLQSIIEYLIKTHLYYINSRLPRIEQFIDLLLENYGRVDMHLYLLKDYFQDYKRDMLAHICIEERDLFPYILRLIKHQSEPLSAVQIFNLLEPNAIKRFHDDHHHVEDELSEIRRRLTNYTEVNKSKVRNTSFFYEFSLFEIDLLTHGRLEDEVLIPKAIAVEESFKKRLLQMANLN